jgi:very-short-patch-repair endonuclease
MGGISLLVQPNVAQRWLTRIVPFVVVHGVLVDAHWPQARLVAELDGAANHSSRAQRHRDRSRELTLRAHGIRVVRYDWQQIHHHPTAVRDDLLAALGS